MNYVLDTTTVWALLAGRSSTVDYLTLLDPGCVSMPQPVIAAIAAGLQRLPSTPQRDELQRRFDRIRAEIPRAVWTDDVSDAFAELHARVDVGPLALDDLDVAIAAHAIARDAILVTARADRMRDIPGLTVENWAT